MDGAESNLASILRKAKLWEQINLEPVNERQRKVINRLLDGFEGKLAEGNFRDYLRGDVVWLKKYLYVLRPICACRWIERGLGPVPMEFSKLVNKTIDDVMLRFAIADLVVRKRNGEELDRAPRMPVISEFVESELARLADIAPEKTEPPPVTDLDVFFRNTLLKAA